MRTSTAPIAPSSPTGPGRISMRVATGSDHAGFELKEAMRAFLIDEHHEVVDVGTHSLDPVDYPDYAIAVAAAVRSNQADRGILICGSGVGASVCANKVNGVRACLIHDHFSAKQGVEDDHMNILCMGGRTVGPEVAWDLVQTYLAAEYSSAPRHLRRLGKVAALESERITP